MSSRPRVTLSAVPNSSLSSRHLLPGSIPQFAQAFAGGSSGHSEQVRVQASPRMTPVFSARTLAALCRGECLLGPAGIAGVAGVELRIARSAAAIYEQRALDAVRRRVAFQYPHVIAQVAAFDARIAEHDDRACGLRSLVEHRQEGIG